MATFCSLRDLITVGAMFMCFGITDRLVYMIELMGQSEVWNMNGIMT